MTTIGLNFNGIKKDKNNKMYYIIQPVTDITPIIIDKDKLLCIR